VRARFNMRCSSRKNRDSHAERPGIRCTPVVASHDE